MIGGSSMQKTLTKINELGSFKLEQANLEDSVICFYVPLENVDKKIKEYVIKGYEVFKSKYPYSQQLDCEMGLLVDFSNSKFNYDILVTYIDDNLEICEFTKILSDYKVTLSVEIELEVKNIVLEALKKEIFGE